MREISSRCGGLGGPAQVRTRRLYKQRAPCARVCASDIKEDLGWDRQMMLDEHWCLSNWASQA